MLNALLVQKHLAAPYRSVIAIAGAVKNKMKCIALDFMFGNNAVCVRKVMLNFNYIITVGKR